MRRSAHTTSTRVFTALALFLAVPSPVAALVPQSSCAAPAAPLESPAMPPGAPCCCGDGGGSCGSMPAGEPESTSPGCGCEIAAPAAPSAGVLPAAVEAPAPRVSGFALQTAACAPSAAPIADAGIYLDIGASPPGRARPLYSILALLLI